MMIYLPLIIILTLCGVHSMKNGPLATDMEFPFVVSIQYRLLHLCSGTIIDKYHILTVAHVVIPYPTPDLLVLPGITEVNWLHINSTISTVKNLYPHPDYEELTVILSGQCLLYWKNDIAILRLNEPLPLDFFTGIVSFSTSNLESYNCFECTMISWNYPDENNLEVVVLMWDFVYIVPNNRCEQWGIYVLGKQQCFIDLLERAFISTEDLGSPITCNGSIVGLIVKEAQQGEAASPATFLSTFNYSDFISETIHDTAMSIKPKDFPYMVSIWHGNELVCGGVILNTYQVITTGQCIQSIRNTYPKQSLKIAAGSSRVWLYNGNAQWYGVSHMEVHPHYRLSYNGNDSSGWAENDIGLLTLSTPFLWSSTIQRLRFANTDDFSTKQVCQVLRWTRKFTAHNREYRELTKATVILVNYEQPLVHLKRFEIAAKELFHVDNRDFISIGNPIICGGDPFGIMVGIYSNDLVSKTPQIIFLRLYPYALERFLNLY